MALTVLLVINLIISVTSAYAIGYFLILFILRRFKKELGIDPDNTCDSCMKRITKLALQWPILIPLLILAGTVGIIWKFLDI